MRGYPGQYYHLNLAFLCHTLETGTVPPGYLLDRRLGDHGAPETRAPAAVGASNEGKGNGQKENE